MNPTGWPNHIDYADHPSPGTGCTMGCGCRCHRHQTQPFQGSLHSYLKSEFTEVKNLISSLHSDNQTLRKEVNELRARLYPLSSTSLPQSYPHPQLHARRASAPPVQDNMASQLGLQVRMRFLEKYKKDSGCSSRFDQELIKKGDGAANRGQPVMDAWLYENNHRQDKKVYTDLYGFTPAQIWKWRNIADIERACAFAAHLRMRLDIPQERRETFRCLFMEFKQLVEKLDSDYAGLTEDLVKKSKPIQLKLASLEDYYDKTLDKYPLHIQ